MSWGDIRKQLWAKLLNMEATERAAALSGIAERKRYVLERRLNGTTLRDLAADMGLHHERVRQIEGRALIDVFGYKPSPTTEIAP